MITRFRIEAEAETQEEVMQELETAVVAALKGIDSVTIATRPKGKWECTQQNAIVAEDDETWEGRMVMKFHPERRFPTGADPDLIQVEEIL